MIFFVLDNPDRLDELLASWESIGITGVTIIESTGIHRVRRQLLPMRYLTWESSNEEGHYSLFAIVQDMLAVDECLKTTERLIGELENPNTGIFAAIPLAMVKGVSKRGVKL